MRWEETFQHAESYFSKPLAAPPAGFPDGQVVRHQLFRHTCGAQFCHFPRQLSAQPGIVAGRIVRDGQVHVTPDHWRIKPLNLVQQAQCIRSGNRAVALVQQVITAAGDESLQALVEAVDLLQLQAALGEGIELAAETPGANGQPAVPFRSSRLA